MISIQNGMNMLQVAGLRLPCLIASCSSVMCTAELVTRAVSSGLEQLGFKGESTIFKSITAHMPEIRPYKDAAKYSNKLLAQRALGHALVGIIGNAAVSYVFGPAPSIYNKVLTFLGPVRISNDLHPAFAYAASRFGR